MKINPADVVVEWAGVRRKHMSVQLRGDQTFAALKDAPEAWGQVQNNLNVALRRSDTLDIYAADGLSVLYGALVASAEGGKVWIDYSLSKIAKLGEVAVFDNGIYQVRPEGSGYRIYSVKTGRGEGPIYGTPRAAEVQIHRKAPKVEAA